jgi:hypothetical protein
VIEKKDRRMDRLWASNQRTTRTVRSELFRENKIKNTNQASRQDRVENSDRISS